MAEHTPGPWRVLFPGIYDVENPYPIAKVHRTDRSGPEVDANARLIAAAPELLEALERLGNQHCPKCYLHPLAYEHSPDCIRITAAIAKAKGDAEATPEMLKELRKIQRIARAAIAKAKGET